MLTQIEVEPDAQPQHLETLRRSLSRHLACLRDTQFSNAAVRHGRLPSDKYQRLTSHTQLSCCTGKRQRTYLAVLNHANLTIVGLVIRVVESELVR